jgi:hypothetical protein
MPPELRRLMLRYCELGRLLPRLDDATSLEDYDLDLSELAGIQCVLNEMARIKGQIDEFLDSCRSPREGKDHAEPAGEEPRV